MATYIYVQPESSKSYYAYECFIVSDDGRVEEPTGYISTTPSRMTGENACFHVKPLQDEVSTPIGKFTLGVNFDRYTGQKPLESGVGINYRWIRSAFNLDYWYYVVMGPGSSGHTSYRSTVKLAPPDGLTCLELNEWFHEHATRGGYSASIYTTRHGWYRYPVSDVRWLGTVDSALAKAVAGSIHWSSSLQTKLDTMYYDAVGELKFNMNNIANGTQVAGLFKSLRSLNSLGKQITKSAAEFAENGLAKDAADAWLKYRYAYLTTKSDVEEFVQKAITDKAADTGVLHCGGSLDGFALNMKIAYKPYENQCLNSLLEFISMPKRLGLDPSLYNIWDMVPFSFVVDWFVPIGDNLERISNQTWAATMPYQTQVLASYKGIVDYWGRRYRVYNRFDYAPTGKWSWISKDRASLLTTTKRGLDVIALTR